MNDNTIEFILKRIELANGYLKPKGVKLELGRRNGCHYGDLLKLEKKPSQSDYIKMAFRGVSKREFHNCLNAFIEGLRLEEGVK